MFEISDSKDKLKLLEEDFRRLMEEPLNITLAEQTCSGAWHLADWVFAEKKVDNPDLTLDAFRTQLYEDCPEFKILHDLVNSFKHKNLSRPKVQITETKKKRGDFSNDFSKDFDVSRLEVHFKDQPKIDLDDLVRVAIDYWNRVLN